MFTICSTNFLRANDCNLIMDSKLENKVLKHIQNKPNDELKLNTIKTYLQRVCIDTNQMTSIILLFEDAITKQEFHLYAKDYIIDLDNYKKLPINY